MDTHGNPSSALDDSSRIYNLLNQLGTCVFSKDQEGRYTYVNDLVCMTFGRSREDIIGKTDAELFPPLIASQLRGNDRQVEVSGQALGFEEDIPYAGTDELHHFWSIKQPLLNERGQATGISGVATDITERKLQEKSILALQNQLTATLAAMPDLMFEIDSEGRYLNYHSPHHHLLAAPPHQLIGRTIEDILPRDVADICAQALIEAAEQGFTSGQQFRLQLPDGEHWFELSIARKNNHQGEKATFIALSRDITDRKQAEQALRAKESLLRAIVDNTPVEYWARDLTGNCIMENALVVKHWGSLIGTTPDNSPVKSDERQLWQENNRRAYAGETVDEETVYIIDGEPRIFQNVVAPIRVDGEIIGIVGFNQDITERKQAEDKIRHLAFFDPLTHLPNRRLMFDRLTHALIGSQRRERQGALLLIDLDNFKQLNDTEGHDVGDRLLLEVAKRLAASIRQGDTAARLGGDEFVVILEDIDGTSPGLIQAENLALHILQHLSQPYALGTTPEGRLLEFHCSSSIGITLFDGERVSAEELLRRADTAMYQAKAAGRNTLRFFDPQMQAAVTRRAALEADLRQAIEQEQFQLYYQPQVDDHQRIVGAEVLLRWLHPERGMVSPAEFIPLAEETGLIIPLGQWVLETACKQLGLWACHPHMANLTLAVNVSARQFRLPSFAERLRELIQYTGARPRRLKLELTESLLLENSEDMIQRMFELKTLGVGFSLDDFGTGYSSLAYLKRLPLDQLKIDQSFVRDVLTDPNDAAIARTIVALGNTLGLAVIAEGVETQEQLAFLADNGCHAYQGYLFGRPQPLADFEARFPAAPARPRTENRSPDKAHPGHTNTPSATQESR